MKKQLFVILAGILLTVGIANADTIQSLPQWILYGNTLKPVVTSSTVQIPSLGSSGNPCVNVNASGTLATSTCGSGGGSGSLASTTPWTVGNLVAVSSGQYLASISSGTYYLATNPNGFTTTTIQSVLNSLSAVSPITINTSTGVIGWTNSNNYITLASLSGLSPISYNSSTGAFSCPTCITVVPTSTITINGISTSSFNFLATGTGLSVSSSSNNITYNWTNPGYITTSTFNATGTPYYVPLWNASGTALTPTSSIFVSSTGNVGIGTTTPNSTLQINGNVAFTSSSTIVTASLGGSALLAGACSSVTSTIDSTVTSSTAAFVTTPQNYPGVGAYWSSYLSAPSVLTTQVCEPVAATPTATAYNIKNY